MDQENGRSHEKYKHLRQIFELHKDEAKAESMAAYMKNHFSFYGIGAVKRKEMTKEIIKQEKAKKEIDWSFLNRCYADNHREMQYFVLDYLHALAKYIHISDLNSLIAYAKEKQWWDTIDGLDKLIGNIDFPCEEIDDLMLRWSTDEDIWLRRIAIDHQNGRKENTNVQLLETIILNNLGQKEFFINKAIGWSLREYSKVNPDWVRGFMETHKDQMAPLSVREGSKYI